MAGSKLNLFGLMCVAALVALPTMQAASTSRDASLVAIAPAYAPPAEQPQAEHQNAGVGGPQADLGTVVLGPSVGADGLAAQTELAAADLPVEPDTSRWLWPTPSRLITSTFGIRSDPLTGGAAFHSGIDLGDPCGTPVGATRPGRVVFAGAAGGYGYRVVVDHGEGVSSSYSHLQQIVVQTGADITQSNAVGLVGSTGRSTGCHLHFEIIVNGGFTDPVPYLTGNPATNPTTFGDGSLPSEPNPEPAQPTSPGPSPSATSDPCQLPSDSAEAVDGGGLIPIDGPLPAECALPDATIKPVPTATSSAAPTSMPSPGATTSSTGTPTASGATSSSGTPTGSGATSSSGTPPAAPPSSTPPSPSTSTAPSTSTGVPETATAGGPGPTEPLPSSAATSSTAPASSASDSPVPTSGQPSGPPTTTMTPDPLATPSGPASGSVTSGTLGPSAPQY